MAVPYYFENPYGASGQPRTRRRYHTTGACVLAMKLEGSDVLCGEVYKGESYLLCSVCGKPLLEGGELDHDQRGFHC